LKIAGVVRKGFVVAVAAAVTCGVASSASAASQDAHGFAYYEKATGLGGVITYRTAEGWFESSGDLWRVCDRMADGNRAKAAAIWYSGGATHWYDVEATGGEGSCSGWFGKDIPEGTKVTLEVWDQDGANGAREHVKAYVGYA